jgi:hypothetical protein
MAVYNNSSINRMRVGWGFLYLVLVSGGLWLVFSHWTYDDPFITYRYARNIAAGFGFVYNPGERILSTTSPLFAIFLALFHKAGVPIPVVANLLSVTSLAVGGLLLWDLARTWKTPWVGWTGLLLYPTFSLLLATIGSETPLYLALCLGGFALYAREKLGWAAVLISLAILARTEAGLIAIVMVIDYLWRKRAELRKISFWGQLPWMGIIVSLGLLIGWYLFAWNYFGSPFPVTLAVKQAQGQMAISTQFVAGTRTILRWYTPYWPYWLAFGLAILGFGYAIFRKLRWLLILAWTGIYFLAYAFLGVSNYYWYYAPLVLGWIVALGLGITLVSRTPVPKKIQNPLRGGHIAVFLIAVFFLTQLNHLNQLRLNPDHRYAIYKAAGDWLAENTAQSSQVGALEIGVIGYYAQRPMIDFAGLLQPKVAEQFKPDSTYEDVAIWAVKQYQPDYLVLFADRFPRLMEKKYITVFCKNTLQLKGRDYQYPADLYIFDCRP